MGKQGSREAGKLQSGKAGELGSRELRKGTRKNAKVEKQVSREAQGNREAGK